MTEIRLGSEARIADNKLRISWDRAKCLPQQPRGEEMSVSGEFQRYLTATLELLEGSGQGGPGAVEPIFAGLRDALESARLNPDTPLAESARRALLALEGFANQTESCTDAAGLLPAVEESAESLRAITRIVLGQSGPLTDRNTSTQ